MRSRYKAHTPQVFLERAKVIVNGLGHRQHCPARLVLLRCIQDCVSESAAERMLRMSARANGQTGWVGLGWVVEVVEEVKRGWT